MYMRRKVCHTVRIAIADRTGAVVLTALSTVSNICWSVHTDYLAQISRFWKAVYINLPNGQEGRQWWEEI